MAALAGGAAAGLVAPGVDAARSNRMEYADHRAVYSSGSYIESKAWRMRQKELIDAGDFRGAIQMDVYDIRARFGSAYDEAIVEMWMSLSSNKALRKWAAKRGQ